MAKKSKPRLPVLYPIFREFRKRAVLFFYKRLEADYPEIKEKGLNPFDENDFDAILRLNPNNELYEPAQRILGVGKEYLYNLENSYKTKSDNDTVKVDYSALQEIFSKMLVTSGQDLFIKNLIKYVKKLDCPSHIRELQVEWLLEVFDRNKEVKVGDYKSLVDKLQFRLSGTSWWLYFYGYPELNQCEDLEFWKLIRLPLYFEKKGEKDDLIVKIKNNENEKHYNFIGFTDFKSSTNKVLVMNLKTETKTRQLNMKIFIDGGKESLYMGQYLNFEADTGRIISGVIVLEQIDDDNEYKNNPIPHTLKIPNNGELSEDLLEIAHIIKLFSNKSEVFRETPIVFPENK